MGLSTAHSQYHRMDYLPDFGSCHHKGGGKEHSSIQNHHFFSQHFVDVSFLVSNKFRPVNYSPSFLLSKPSKKGGMLAIFNDLS